MSTQKITRGNLQASILVVDDESGIIKLLDDYLSAEFTVAVASSANEALGLLGKHKFDIALVDVNMPEMSGNELFKVCIKKYPDMQFILMTGMPEFADAINAVKDGAFYYLLKPLDLKLLHSLIMKAVREKKESSGTVICDAGIIKNLGPKYRIIRSLGAGSAGAVLLVESNGRLYAMKLLRFDNSDENYANSIERFMREAEILMRIKNEHVVRIIEHNLGKTDESPYMVMEYVEGMPLSECIRENKIDIHQKISIIQQIAETLDCVHRHGVLHRDIKPDNILLTGDLFVKMTDFGICYVPGSSLTVADEVLGSPEYMAPESFEAGRKPDLKVDMFSLGVVSYEMLAGKRPFSDDTISRVIDAVKFRKPVAPVKLNSEIPLWMQDVMAKMLDKNLDRRFESCGEISKAINYHLSGGGKMKSSLTTRIFRSMLTPDNVWK